LAASRAGAFVPRSFTSSIACIKQVIGIGDGLTSRDTQGVVAGLRAIAAQAVPLTACGVTSDDVAAAAQLATDRLGADDRQGAARDARADTTESHLDGQLRLEAAVDEISARGALAMRRDAVARGRFERLISATGPSKEDEDLAGPEPAPIPAGPPA